MKYGILLVIFILCLISSAVLAIQEEPLLCKGGESGCSAVTTSPYAYTFGIKNSQFGVAIFLFLSALTFLQLKKPTKIQRRIIYVGIIIGAAFAFYFLYLQQFVLHAYCVYCLVVDTLMLISLIILLTWQGKE
ncbi:vitamin K epoxide reductase family protein [Candidatus Pacearchaeota archaeon]|nr:vitamin K epoxide reductase family protein [Candidatus Pacearchaeota archaeon]